jgi:hypothetical protein
MMIVFVLNILDTKIKVSSGVNQQTMAIVSITDASVNIMFHGLINPCIHLIESHQLYIVLWMENQNVHKILFQT